MGYSLIIPVLKMEDNPYLPDLLKALEKQTIKPEAVVIVAGDHRQGRAINYGVTQIESDYVGTVDDDSVIDDDRLFEKLLDEIQGDSSIGMAGAACDIPAYAGDFQKRAMREIPRRFFPVQSQTVDSDMVQHPCLLMSRILFEEIGGEDEELIRGLDPVLRKKVRDAGKRVVIVKNTWVYHLIPDGFWRLLKMYYRNGRGSGYAQRHFPDRVLELGDGYEQNSFVEKRPLVFRAVRRLFSLMKGVLTGRFLLASTDIAYSLGVARERFFPGGALPALPVNKIEKEKLSGHPFDLLLCRVHLGRKT